MSDPCMAEVNYWETRLRLEQQFHEARMNRLADDIEKDQRISALEEERYALLYQNNKDAHRIAALESVVKAWQAGFSRGHDDTVEGCFNPGYADDPEAAQEWLDEWNRQKREQT